MIKPKNIIVMNVERLLETATKKANEAATIEIESFNSGERKFTINVYSDLIILKSEYYKYIGENYNLQSDLDGTDANCDQKQAYEDTVKEKASSIIIKYIENNQDTLRL